MKFGAKKKVLTKTQSLAEQAMNLHHSQGMSLKQAWGVVQKFGNQSRSVPHGKEVNEKTGRLRNICEPPNTRDKRGSCVKPRSVPPGKEINEKTGRLRNICEPPNTRDKRGSCVKPRSVPPGKEINEKTGRLRNICEPPNMRSERGPCLKPGYVTNPKTGKPELAFKKGYYRSPSTNRWNKIPRMAGVTYDISNVPINLDRIRRTKSKSQPPLDISDHMDFEDFEDENMPTMVYGKKSSKCGFGTCNACALKNKFGKKATPIPRLRKKEELIKVAVENGIDYNKCTELTKDALYLKLKKEGLWPPPASQDANWFNIFG